MSEQRTEPDLRVINFAEFPESFAEKRAIEEDNAAMNTPRDALIAVLRAIDNGNINPDALVICYRMKKGAGVTASNFEIASPDLHTSLGLLEYTKHLMTRVLS